MGRPRQYNLDELLRDARALWTESGIAGVTMRALSSVSGASNGALYHAFGSRDGLLARVWAREAEHFLAFQRELVEREMNVSDPVAALVAAALAPASYAVQNEESARLLLSADADELLTPELDAAGHAQVLSLQLDLGRLLLDLAGALWGRRDRAAVTIVRYCVVTLPGALLLRGDDVNDPLARHALERAVRGIASSPPPAATGSPARNRDSTS
jgi:AcrR family transcriptional regulator